ncbi:MAG: DUF2309 family protein [Bacteroidetes bacterium]|nr:DUF2309 family protein [Bacteroidota bacterium]
MTLSNYPSTTVDQIIRKACGQIAPYFSLENFVAVNPYQSYASKDFNQTSQELAKYAGMQSTMDSAFYLRKIEQQEIIADDLIHALQAKNISLSVDEFLHKTRSGKQEANSPRISSWTQFLSEKCGVDYCNLLLKSISQWAASYFDRKQSVWKNPYQDEGIYRAWKAEYEIDRSLDLAGLSGFRKAVETLPYHPMNAIRIGLKILKIPESELMPYCTLLLYELGGWSAWIAGLDWNNKLEGTEETRLSEFLAILISCESILCQLHSHSDWKASWAAERMHILKQPIDQSLEFRLILHDAYERSFRRKLRRQFEPKSEQNNKKASDRISVQAVFCIDVRSELIRRNLEKMDPGIQTIGFAGFFGMPIGYKPIGQENPMNQCPVLLQPAYEITDLPRQDDQPEAKMVVMKRQFKQLQHLFKSSAIACFGFVSPLGLSFLPKLIGHSFARTKPASKSSSTGNSGNTDRSFSGPDTSQIPLNEKVVLAKNALIGMGIDKEIAPLVLIVGHGSSSINNPHASGLDCGACGGHSGGINARVASAILNTKEVRNALLHEGISIPDETLFLAALHDTTTDEVQILENPKIYTGKAKELEELKTKLRQASEMSRKERARRLSLHSNKEINKQIRKRSNDWSEIRPEWGLAGCTTFVIADRSKTKHLDLGGKSFLHSYSWKKDPDYSLLEQIMTAPMVVTSWINLQYFASMVEPDRFGAGNKTLHNVTAGIGVFEGRSGDLKTGLPFQSVHDGEDWQHDPIKLHVLLDAPEEAINSVLEKHPNLKNLADNKWIHLLHLDKEGKTDLYYSGNLNWSPLAAGETVDILEEVEL